MILWANKAALNLLGYERDEYVGHHMSEFHVERAEIDEILRKLLAGEGLIDQPAKLRCKDGSIKHVLINSNAYFEDGEFIHTRCFTRDVTARVKVEEELRRYAEELALSNEELYVFSYAASHDLQEPLRTIQSFINISVEILTALLAWSRHQSGAPTFGATETT